MRCLGILILLMLCTSTQAQQIGLVQTRSFYDRDHGLKQLIRSLEAGNPSFFGLEKEPRDAEFDRISSRCVQPESKREWPQDSPCFVIDRVAASLEKFAKDRGILILLDPSYRKPTSRYWILDGHQIEDITERFVNEYNSNNP